MATSTSPIRIALVISTVRQPRVCPRVAQFVHDTITTLHPSSSSTPPYELHTLDLLDHPLPFHNEPLIPQFITTPEGYTHEHTRAWSRLISSFDAFIFVTPQYNWGYPGVLKNAIDYLFNEWKGKPAMVVSYGGHGGNKANAQLREVLMGLKMLVGGEGAVELVLKGREMVLAASRGEDVGAEQAWADKKEDVVKGFVDMVGKCRMEEEVKG